MKQLSMHTWASQVAQLVKNPLADVCRRCRRHEFDPWVRKIPWRRKWQPTPMFLPGKSHRGAWWVTVHGVAKSRTRLATEQRAYYSLLRTAIKTGWHQNLPPGVQKYRLKTLKDASNSPPSQICVFSSKR